MPTATETDIEISHAHGNVTVKGWDREEVKLEGKKIVKAKDEETAQRYAEQMKVEIISEDGKIIVRAIRPEPDRSWEITQRTINYELYAPTRLNVSLKNAHGNVLIESFMGKCDSNSRHGNLQVAQIGKDIAIQHEHGNVEVSQIGGSASVSKRHGNLKIESVRGELELSHSHGHAELAMIGARAVLTKRHGNLNAVDVGGPLKLDYEHGNARLKRIEGDVEIKKRHGHLDMETINGNFSISTEHGHLDAIDIKGDVHLRGSHGNTRLENVSGLTDMVCSHRDVELHNIGGGISVKNAHGSIEVISSLPVTHPYLLSTKHANLRLALPENANIDLSARTEHGRINSSLPLTITTKRNEMIAEGKINDGGTKIELSVRHGNIDIDSVKK